MTGPRLDIRHLQMIRYLGRTGRVVDAADALGLTPSALSHRIKEAERRLGVPLFERMHKRLRMTAAAEYLANFSEEFLGELHLIEEEVRRMNAGIDHVVRLSVEHYSAFHWFPEFLVDFQETNRGIDIQIMAGGRKELLPSLLDRNVDIVISTDNGVRTTTQSKALFEDELVLVCAPGHALAKHKRVTAGDIEGQKFITFTKVPEPDQEFAKLFRAEGRYPNWMSTVELPEAIVELVAAGQGTSILSSWAMQPHVASGRIVAKPLAPNPIALMWKCEYRSDEPDTGPVSKVARSLAAWFGPNTTYLTESASH